MTVHPFAPIADEHSKTLILGTMPSVQSRKLEFYYSNPQNRFWRVVAACFGSPLPQTIEEKTELILKNNLALWDVLAACEIVGSSDASIREPRFNDLAGLLPRFPIEKIVCNGQKSRQLLRECLSGNIPIVCLPSTSPANAAWTEKRLVEEWRRGLTA